MENEKQPLIELAGVEVVQADAGRVLVRGVDWRIGPGEFWVVGGAPGSGVSSLLTTAAGLNRPGEGTLRIFGRELAAASEAEQVEWRRRIGYVFERGGRLLSHLTVAQNIALPLAYHSALDPVEIRDKVEQWLMRAELTECAGLMPSQLTPRLQQRASFVRALIVPSAVVFLDDPPVRLGTGETRWWREQAGELCRQGVTVVVGSSHFAAWLDVVATATFALLQDGHFVIIGDAKQVRADRGAVWREFVTVD